LLGRAHYIQGHPHRRQFEFDEALRALDQASKLLTSVESKGDALTERGLVLVKTGKLTEAAKAFESVLENHAKAPRAAEARVLPGGLRLPHRERHESGGSLEEAGGGAS